MPYVDQTRPYTRSTSARYPNHWTLPDWTWWRNGVAMPHYGDEVDPFCTERTYSYRTGARANVDQPVMTGQDMRNAILRGDDLMIDPSAPGGIVNTGEKISRYGFNFDTGFDNGHEFVTQKVWRTYHTFVDCSRTVVGINYRYKGALMPYLSGGSIYPTRAWNLSAPEKGRLLQLGNQAIADSAPTAPEANLATMIAELHQLPTLPALSLMRKGYGTPREWGGEFLNIEFGWKPFISDIRKLAEAVIKSNMIVEQMIIDAGKNVRRKRLLVDQEKTSSVVQKTISFTSPRVDASGRNWTTLGPSSAQGQQLDESVESVWFSGAFSYFLDETDSLLGRISYYEALANQLLGGRLTAAAVWELTPWSWLIDWFLDIQSFVTRMSRLAEDNLVLKYGYVMRSQELTRTLMCPNIVAFDGTVIPTPQVTGHVVRKERLRSTPYGFGLDVNALSAERWAILAALGFTKSPGSLRTL